MMHLHQPILLPPKGQPLRVLIHARFSTEEQRQSSIDDQVAACRTFLESNLPKGWTPGQLQVDVITEPEVGGEIADRLSAAVAEELPVPIQRMLLINAFAEPELVRHARLIVTRRLEGKTYKEIAKECDLTKYHMENCARITRLMEEAGFPEPYRRLTEKPDTVSRWCSKHWLKAGERKGGGKRRRAG